MRVERLPFTVYDIVGYLVPGLFVVAPISWLFWTSEVGSFLQGNLTTTALITSMIATLIGAYVVGQLLALIAAESLGRLIEGFTGPPSALLTYGIRHTGPYLERTMALRVAREESTRFWLSYLLLLPSSLVIEALILLGKTEFLVRPATPELKSQLCKRFSLKYGLQPDFGGSGDGWFELVESDVTNNNPVALTRMYNYLTLYGFHRNIGTAAFFLFWIVLGLYFAGRWSSSVDIVQLMLPLGIIGVGSTFGFLKFRLRYSLEAIRAFALTDEKSS